MSVEDGRGRVVKKAGESAEEARVRQRKEAARAFAEDFKRKLPPTPEQQERLARSFGMTLRE